MVQFGWPSNNEMNLCIIQNCTLAIKDSSEIIGLDARRISSTAFRLAIITNFHNSMWLRSVWFWPASIQWIRYWLWHLQQFKCYLLTVAFFIFFFCPYEIAIAQTRTYCSFTYSLFWNIWFDGRKENETNLILMAKKMKYAAIGKKKKENESKNRNQRRTASASVS